MTYPAERLAKEDVPREDVRADYAARRGTTSVRPSCSRSAEVEPAQPARLPLGDVHAIHHGMAWTALAPSHHRLDLEPRALEVGPHGAIGLVPGPAADICSLGLLLAARPEEDTLHDAVHDDLPSDHVRCRHGSIIRACHAASTDRLNGAR